MVKKRVLKLKSEFKKNGLFYRLIKRTDKVAMFGTSKTPNGTIYDFEVFLIFERSPNPFNIHFKETVPANSEFGILRRSLHFNKNSRPYIKEKRKKMNYEEYYEYLVKLTENG